MCKFVYWVVYPLLDLIKIPTLIYRASHLDNHDKDSVAERDLFSFTILTTYLKLTVHNKGGHISNYHIY